MIRTRTPIRNRSLFALAATMCFATGPASGGGMSQPMPVAPGGTQEGTHVDSQEEKPFEDSDLSEEAEEWRKQHGKTSAAPLSTNTEPEGGAMTAISAGEELGTGPGGDKETALQRDKEQSPEEKQKALEPAPTHFGHRLQKSE